jgi:hypothetical protein
MRTPSKRLVPPSGESSEMTEEMRRDALDGRVAEGVDRHDVAVGETVDELLRGLARVGDLLAGHRSGGVDHERDIGRRVHGLRRLRDVDPHGDEGVLSSDRERVAGDRRADPGAVLLRAVGAARAGRDRGIRRGGARPGHGSRGGRVAHDLRRRAPEGAEEEREDHERGALHRWLLRNG